MTLPPQLEQINEVLEKSRQLKQDTIGFVKYMQGIGFHISLDGLQNLDKIIAGKRLAEYYQEYRKQLKNKPEPNPPSSDWNRCADVDVKLTAEDLHKLTGMPLPERFSFELGEDRYAEIKSKILKYISEHKSSTLRELSEKLEEEVYDIFSICLILAQKNKISMWQNEAYKEVFITST